MGCCDSGLKKPKVEKKFIQSKTMVNERWQVYRLIAYGNYGMVFDVIDTKSPNRTHFAIKTEQLVNEGDRGRLPSEKQVMDDLKRSGKTNHFPQVFDHGLWESQKLKKKFIQYIIMTLLGPSLVELASVCPRLVFSSGTVSSIGVQILEALESMHEIGYLHRDIKPANVNVGRPPNTHEIFLVDFGLARKYLDENGQRLQPRRRAPFRGTAPYASLRIHDEQEHGPCDDLWSMFYTLADLRLGSLPWANLVEPSESAHVKKKVIPYQWLKRLEPQYLEVYEYLTSLYYDIKPDYKYVSNLFVEMLKRSNLTPQSPMDWEYGSNCFDKYYRLHLDDIFIK